MKKHYVVFLAVLIIGFAFLSVKTSAGQFLSLQSRFIGKSVPEFVRDTLTAKQVSLKDYRQGKKAILFFWATWCPNCREALVRLNERQAELAGKNIRLILVNLGEPSATVANYLRRNGIQMDAFLDEGSELQEVYDIMGIPTFFFVNAQGIVKAVRHGLPEDYEDILSRP
jgi:thiol-disulfide isomerase/thioredoxin